MFADNNEEIKKICEEIKKDYKNLPNKQLRFKAYKAIARYQYGHLTKGCKEEIGYLL